VAAHHKGSRRLAQSIPAWQADRVPERWWDGDAAEIFWLEITDRDDLGVDLHAPAADEDEDE
jgi:hypothetical protein